MTVYAGICQECWMLVTVLRLGSFTSHTLPGAAAHLAHVGNWLLLCICKCYTATKGNPNSVLMDICFIDFIHYGIHTCSICCRVSVRQLCPIASLVGCVEQVCPEM